MFGQFIIGPPGSGKSTFCNGMQQFLTCFERKVAVVNLDPANDAVPYDCALDVSELIRLEDAMEEFNLGPNGGLIYCIEYLVQNLEWLKTKLKALGNRYFLFDCPGQVELYTHHTGMRTLVHSLQQWGSQLCVVHLVDSHHCSDPAKFVSVLLVTLASMCHLEMPHVNILSKIDLVEQYGTLAFGLEFFTDVLDLNYLLEHLESDPFAGRYQSLNCAICSLIQDYDQVAFNTLNVADKHSMDRVLRSIDKANGYIFGDMERSKRAHNLLYNFDGTKGQAEFEYGRTMEVQETYMRDLDPGTVQRPTLPGSDAVRMQLPLPVDSAQARGGSDAARPAKACWSCLAAEGKLRCGACKQAYYCSQACQRKHWQQHKRICKTMSAGGAEPAPLGGSTDN